MAGMMQISAAALAEIDGGRVARAIDAELEAVVRDCLNRPGDDAARKVTIEIAIKPAHTSDSGELEIAGVTFAVRSSVPKRTSRTYQAAVDVKRRKLSVNEFSPDNPNQGSLIE